MGLFSKAKDNYENRAKIADYNYRAKEYVQSGNEAYQNAYNDLLVACDTVQGKMRQFFSYKQDVVREINKILKKVDSQSSELKLTTNIPSYEIEASGVRVESWEKLTLADKIIDTWKVPSLLDFVVDVDSSDVFEAKMNMQRARNYRDSMKIKKQELRDARSAVKELPGFMNEEKYRIEGLMDKFKKAAKLIHSEQDTEQIEALREISKLLADSLMTEFIDNNYQITGQYQNIHNRMGELNDSLSSVQWLIEG